MKKGVIFSACGRRFYEEALGSARSIKQKNKDIHITVYTDQSEVSNRIFDNVRRIDSPENPFLSKIESMLKSQYDRTLFLDSDTFIAGDISPVFSLLDQFDIAAAHAPVRVAKSGDSVFSGYSIDGVPPSFPEFNTGVLLWRDTEASRQLLQSWRQRYSNITEQLGEVRNDQPAFREAAYTSSARLSVLPPEYNLRLPYPAYLYDEAKILHGRVPDPEIGSRKINRRIGARVYIPGFGVVLREGLTGKLLRGIEKAFYRIKNII